MNIFQHVNDFEPTHGTVVTIGTFDGVHSGHKQLIQQLHESATELTCQSVVLTFHPHPRMVIFPDHHGLQLLNTLNERIEIFRKLGVENLIIHPFTREFSQLNATQFVRDILVNKLKMQKLIIGHDHHFGRNRQGNFSELEELAPVYNFEVIEVKEYKNNDVVVSSTKIRNALLAGDVAAANLMLGYAYQISGTVVHGQKLGRELGFPTANIAALDAQKLIPATGVYVATVTLYDGNSALQTYCGALSISTRPTFDNGEVRIEVFIIDFSKEIYGCRITVDILAHVRHDMKFENQHLLVAQMHKDIEVVKNYFTANHHG